MRRIEERRQTDRQREREMGEKKEKKRQTERRRDIKALEFGINIVTKPWDKCMDPLVL